MFDLFNLKRIEELEAKIAYLEMDNNSKKNTIAYQDNIIENYKKLAKADALTKSFDTAILEKEGKLSVIIKGKEVPNERLKNVLYNYEGACTESYLKINY